MGLVSRSPLPSTGATHHCIVIVAAANRHCFGSSEIAISLRLPNSLVWTPRPGAIGFFVLSSMGYFKIRAGE